MTTISDRELDGQRVAVVWMFVDDAAPGETPPAHLRFATFETRDDDGNLVGDGWVVPLSPDTRSRIRRTPQDALIDFLCGVSFMIMLYVAQLPPDEDASTYKPIGLSAKDFG